MRTLSLQRSCVSLSVKNLLFNYTWVRVKDNLKIQCQSSSYANIIKIICWRYQLPSSLTTVTKKPRTNSNYIRLNQSASLKRTWLEFIVCFFWSDWLLMLKLPWLLHCIYYLSFNVGVCRSSCNWEKSLRHVAMVAKFLDFNKPWSCKFWKEKKYLTCMTFLHDCTQEQKSSPESSPNFSSIVRQLKLPSLSRKVVEIQKFCFHGNVALPFSFNFSWYDCNIQEKLETMVMQNFGGIQGALWSMWKWWMGQNVVNLICRLFVVRLHLFNSYSRINSSVTKGNKFPEKVTLNIMLIILLVIKT